MSQQFPVKKFVHVASGNKLEGEVVLESTLSWQVAVGGKIQILEKKEWSIQSDLFGSSRGGGFDDIFSMFGGR